MPIFSDVMVVATAVLMVAAVVASEGKHSLKADLARARSRVPRNPWRGHDFKDMADTLTSALRRGGSIVRSCDQWTIAELQQLQRRLFQEADTELLHIYSKVQDNRQQRFTNLSALDAHWKALDKAAMVESLNETRRDGLCHEAVMWWVHHLSTPSQKQLLHEGIQVPSLPRHRHIRASDGLGTRPAAGELVFREYDHQVSCQQCHTGKIIPGEGDASVSPPLPVDKAHPGLERVRSCDFENHPPCGPCEGLGGRRWGDGAEEMTPMPCQIISGPEVPALTRGTYPSMAIGNLTGDTRWPLSGKEDGHGHYNNMTATLYLGWQGNLMRMRYDFDDMHVTQTSIQTLEQARAGDVGATVSITPKGCSCGASIAGNMHIHAFESSDPLDPIKLPADKGGAAYLGRVRVALDGDSSLSNRTAIADHYMKWAFHFLVDADKNSPTFGLPLRLYASWGVRQVFGSWYVGNPVGIKPDVWDMPKNCAVNAPACSVFGNLSTVKQPFFV